MKGNPVLNVEDEILADVPGYEGIYKVSTKGYITNGRKRMKTYKINSGYEALKLVSVHGRESVLLHRVVAGTFLPNPDNKPEVNHKNGDKSDCSLGNLEWATSSENKRHARHTGLSAYNTPTLGTNKGKTSRYHNVTWDRLREKWIGCVRHNKRTYHQKRFASEEDAALHVNWILDELGLNDRPRNIIN